MKQATAARNPTMEFRFEKLGHVARASRSLLELLQRWCCGRHLLGSGLVTKTLCIDPLGQSYDYERDSEACSCLICNREKTAISKDQLGQQQIIFEKNVFMVREQIA